MLKIKSALLLFIPVFTLLIWILAMAEPTAQSLAAYMFFAVLAAAVISYSTVMALEYLGVGKPVL